MRANCDLRFRVSPTDTNNIIKLLSGFIWAVYLPAYETEDTLTDMQPSRHSSNYLLNMADLIIMKT